MISSTLAATRRLPRVVGGVGQHVLVQDPPPGLAVEITVGRQLALRFRARVGASRWRVAERPQHLMPLAAEEHELCFLVFGGAAGRVRLERADPAGGPVLETRDLTVVPVLGRSPDGLSARPTPRAVAGRTPRSAAPGTASR